LRLRSLMKPRLDAPLPLWMIFPVVFAALYASHFNLLRVPYYWDEAGYYIPAAWDFFRTGSLIPITTVTNAHPPLPSIYLALWWKISGFYPEVTREAVLMVAALGLLSPMVAAGAMALSSVTVRSAVRFIVLKSAMRLTPLAIKPPLQLLVKAAAGATMTADAAISARPIPRARAASDTIRCMIIE